MPRAVVTPPERPSTRHAAARRLALVIGAVVFVDTMFYAVIAPLLPSLAHELRLSKLSAGVMTASYPIGMLLASLPGGLLAARAGPRFTVCAGLVLLACSTIAFAFLRNAAALDAARFVEGVGGACSWAGGLAWVAGETAPDRRGEMMGWALGAAIGGALFGPVIGTIATATGRPVTFGAVAVVAGVLVVLTSGLPTDHARSEQGLGSVTAALRQPGVGSGMWLMGLPAIASGIISVLGPLRLHGLGAPAAAIGATYLVAAAVEAAIAPVVGRLSDRRGRLVPLRFGLAAATVALLCFTLPDSVVGLALVIVVIVAAIGVFWAPSMAMLSDAAETHGLHQGLAAALMNLAWAGGQIIGSGGGGAAAKIAGDGVPVAAAAGACAVTLAVLAWTSS
ncbi:MAG TPA: MFS transporter [Solirubrobacteraceae bacterium]|nr:MFS transporter [Solirubrobacteraceae bacterium]